MMSEFSNPFLHRCLVEALQVPGDPEDPDLPAETAAVAVVLQPDPAHGLAALWIRRAENERDPWSGHMGFPGGRFDPGDSDSRATAERETREELGLDLATHALHLGALRSHVVYNRSGRAPFQLAAHAYWLPEPQPLTPQPSEVAAVHAIALRHLSDPSFATHKQIEWQGKPLRFPGIRYRDRVIWGLSYKIWVDLRGRLERTDLGSLWETRAGDAEIDLTSLATVGAGD